MNDSETIAQLTQQREWFIQTLEALLDIWDDAQRPHEYRAYVEGAWREQIEETRRGLASLLAKGAAA